MNPYQAYRRQNESVAWTRIDMLLALYDRAIEQLTTAHRLLRANDRRSALPLLSKAQIVVNALASGVRIDLNEERGTNLLVLFEFVVRRISEAHDTAVADALSILHILRKGYEAIRPQAVELERQGKLPRAEQMRMVQGIA